MYEEYPCDVAHALAVAHLLISYRVGVQDVIEPPLTILEGRGEVGVAGEGSVYSGGTRSEDVSKRPVVHDIL